MNRLLIMVLLLGVSACSNRAMYDNVQINQRNECLKEPPSRYEECMAHANKSYEEYERERKELQKK